MVCLHLYSLYMIVCAILHLFLHICPSVVAFILQLFLVHVDVLTNVETS